jgi:cobaltochelatase CobS
MPRVKKSDNKILVAAIMGVLEDSKELGRDDCLPVADLEKILRETKPNVVFTKPQFKTVVDVIAFSPGVEAQVSKSQITGLRLASGPIRRTFVEKVIEREIETEVEVETEIVCEVQMFRGKKKILSTEDLFHCATPKILSLIERRKNILLFGPTGTGKSFISSQLAKSVKLPFGFVSCTTGMSESKIGGKLLPVAKAGQFAYVISEFIRFYENGGIFLLDELDAADPNVLLFINAALSSDVICVENRFDNPYAKKHKDFVCIATANTAGTGADRQYSGRQKLDASTLDRFQVGKIYLGYDNLLEAKLLGVDCTVPNTPKKKGNESTPTKQQFAERCWKIRRAIENHGLERAMSTRFILDGWEMIETCDWKLSDIDESYFAGWREDEINKVKASIGESF